MSATPECYEVALSKLREGHKVVVLLPDEAGVTVLWSLRKRLTDRQTHFLRHPRGRLRAAFLIAAIRELARQAAGQPDTEE